MLWVHSVPVLHIGGWQAGGRQFFLGRFSLIQSNPQYIWIMTHQGFFSIPLTVKVQIWFLLLQQCSPVLCLCHKNQLWNWLLPSDSQLHVKKETKTTPPPQKTHPSQLSHLPPKKTQTQKSNPKNHTLLSKILEICNSLHLLSVLFHFWSMKYNVGGKASHKEKANLAT